MDDLDPAVKAKILADYIPKSEVLAAIGPWEPPTGKKMPWAHQAGLEWMLRQSRNNFRQEILDKLNLK